jgi:endonuclease/exonuclease/phosphatase family metal-dependent hydrolase
MMHFFTDLANFVSQIVPRPFVCYHFVPSDLPIPVLQEGKKKEQRHFVDVLTYNVNYESFTQDRCADQIIDAIQSSNADVVFLQETNAAWEERICESTQYPHSYFRHPAPNERPAGGTAILSRFPIHNTSVLHFQDQVGADSVFPACTATINQTPLGTLRVANVHLRPPLELDGSATLSTARTTGPIRDAEVAELLKKCPQLDLVVGDFNEGDGSNALTRLESQTGMRDALQEFVSCSKETHRWPFGRYLTMRKRLDHITYGSRLQCVGCGVLTGYEVGASDHQPVLARFVLLASD